MAKSETRLQKDSRDKLVNEIDKIVQKSYQDALDYVEVALGNPEKWTPLRSKILRSMNVTKREIATLLAKSYFVEFEIVAEDLIVFNKHGNK